MVIEFFILKNHPEQLVASGGFWNSLA